MSKILFLGDLFYHYETISNDMEKIIQFIQKNKYQCILNLEGPLCLGDYQKSLKIGPNLKQSKITIDLLKKLNVIGVTLSNNHMFDYGKEGLLDTISILNQNGIQHCGAGKNIKEACQPMKFSIDGTCYQIFNYGWNMEETKYAKKKKAGCAPRKEKIVLKDLKCHEQTFQIHLFHWGFEYSIYPQPYDIELAHSLIKKGSNLIIGHHPHVMQAYEEYCGVPIYYSLGNFYFSDRRDIFSQYHFSVEPIDRLNYGMGLLFDTVTQKIEKRILFYYNFKIQQTDILDVFDDRVLPTITGKDYTSSDYKQLIKDNRINNNPIYTHQKFLNIYYWLKQKIFRVWCLMGIKYPKIDRLKKKVKKWIKNDKQV